MTRAISSVYVNSYRYDAAVDAKTTGAKVLRGPVLPSGAIISDAMVVVDSALAGGTVTDTVSLGSGESATDLQTALARNNALWAGAGVKRLTLVASGAPVLTTADRAPTFTINSTALTGGKFRLLLTIVEVV